MDELSQRISNLKNLTRELAEEIEYEKYSHVLDFIKLILDAIKSPAMIITKDYKVIFINKEALKLSKKYKVTIDYSKTCYEMQYGTDKPCKDCPAKKAIKSRQVENSEWTSHLSGMDYMVTDIPLLFNGVAGVIEVLNPIKRLNNVK